MFREQRARFLSRMIRDLGYKYGAEIGVWRASLSIALLALTDIKRLYMIDSWQVWDNLVLRDGIVFGGRYYDDRKALDRWNAEPVFERNYQLAVKRAEQFNGRAQIIRHRSPEAANYFRDGSLDFVYIDASHFYEHVVADINAWRPKIRPGGCLMGDDYQAFGEVKQAVDELVAKPRTAGEQWYAFI